MKVALLTSQKDMAECGKTLNVMTSSCALVIVCGSVVLAVHQKSTLCGYCSDDDDYCSSVCEKYHQDGLSWLMLAYFILLKTLWVRRTNRTPPPFPMQPSSLQLLPYSAAHFLQPHYRWGKHSRTHGSWCACSCASSSSAAACVHDLSTGAVPRLCISSSIRIWARTQ